MLLELAIFQKKCKTHHDLNLKKLSIKQTSPFLQQNEKKKLSKSAQRKKLNQLLYVCHEKKYQKDISNFRNCVT